MRSREAPELDRVLRIFGPNRNEVKGSGENFIMRSFMICNPHPILRW
jgi:hypothetical protein